MKGCANRNAITAKPTNEANPVEKMRMYRKSITCPMTKKTIISGTVRQYKFVFTLFYEHFLSEMIERICQIIHDES